MISNSGFGVTADPSFLGFLEFSWFSKVFLSFLGFVEFSRAEVTSEVTADPSFLGFLKLSQIFSSFLELGRLEFSRVFLVFSST